MPANVLVEPDPVNGVVVVEPSGRLDSGQIEKLEKIVNQRLDSGSFHLVIDFKSTFFIASSGLRLLVVTHRRVGEEQGRLVLCGMSEHINSLFKVSGFCRFFEIVPGRAEAVVKARPPGYPIDIEPEVDEEPDEPAPRGYSRAAETTFEPRPQRRRRRPGEAPRRRRRRPATPNRLHEAARRRRQPLVWRMLAWVAGVFERR